ncbi:hypothetical protein JHK85_003687 [Glycine max]|nr:hypothetical protein JHK85_003687 [Glycine max]
MVLVKKLSFETMLGEESEDDDQKGLDSTESNDDQDEEEELMQIKDETETNLVNLRKTIYSAIYVRKLVISFWKLS